MTKPREAFPADEHATASAGLQRSLGAFHLVVLGVGAIIGAGIFVATGAVAANHTGPALAISFVIAAFGCGCAGLCYAEFAAMVPDSGSALSYVTLAFGRTLGWMVGWCLVLEYLMAGSTVAVGWSGYFNAFCHSIGLDLPAALASSPLALSRSGALEPTGTIFNAPAVALLWTLTLVSVAGVTFSIRATAVLVAVKLLVLGVFIVAGAYFVDPANWRPFVPPNTGVFGEFGWSGVLRGAAILFYAFLGFDAVSTAAREARNPQRTVPAGIFGSLALALVVYIGFSLVLTGLAPYAMLSGPSPASTALEHGAPGLPFLRGVVEIGAVVGLTSSLMVVLYALSRVLYAMGKDGLIPPLFVRVGRRTGAPYVCILAVGVGTSIAAGLLPVDALSQMISIGTLTAFVFVCLGVLVLRITRPELERPFRTPAAPLVCVVGVLVCGYLLATLPGATWMHFAVWSIMGGGLYLGYGRARQRRLIAEPRPAE